MRGYHAKAEFWRSSLATLLNGCNKYWREQPMLAGRLYKRSVRG